MAGLKDPRHSLQLPSATNHLPFRAMSLNKKVELGRGGGGGGRVSINSASVLKLHVLALTHGCTLS